MNSMFMLILLLTGPGNRDSIKTQSSWMGALSLGSHYFQPVWNAGYMTDFTSRDRLIRSDSHPGDCTLVNRGAPVWNGGVLQWEYGSLGRLSARPGMYKSKTRQIALILAESDPYISHRGEIPPVFYSSSVRVPNVNPLDSIRWRRYEARTITIGFKLGGIHSMHFRPLPIVDVYGGAGVSGAVMGLRTIEKLREDHPQFRVYEGWTAKAVSGPPPESDLPQTKMSIIEDPYLVWRKVTGYGPVFQVSGTLRTGASLRVIRNRTSQVGIWAFGEVCFSGDANSAQRGGFFLSGQRMVLFGIRVMK